MFKPLLVICFHCVLAFSFVHWDWDPVSQTNRSGVLYFLASGSRRYDLKLTGQIKATFPNGLWERRQDWSQFMQSGWEMSNILGEQVGLVKISARVSRNGQVY